MGNLEELDNLTDRVLLLKESADKVTAEYKELSAELLSKMQLASVKSTLSSEASAKVMSRTTISVDAKKYRKNVPDVEFLDSIKVSPVKARKYLPDRVLTKISEESKSEYLKITRVG